MQSPSRKSPERAEIVDRSPNLNELEAEAGYQRNRLALYRRRILTGKPTTPQRLREIERAMESARERLRRARARGLGRS